MQKAQICILKSNIQKIVEYNNKETKLIKNKYVYLISK